MCKCQEKNSSEEFRSLLESSEARHLEPSAEEHPFTYCMEVVVPAMAKGGKEPSDPKAFCGWWKQEHMSAGDLKELHVCAATGSARTEVLDNKEYLVVPVVALMEGVIHPVNAPTPEFVPLETIKKAAASWNGKPVTLGHPVKEGKQCSANSPDVIEARGIGFIRNSRVEGTKLLQEAWIEKKKARKLHPEMMTRLEANESESVSVGAFVHSDDTLGEYHGKRYRGSWLATIGDHLALLPGGRGACSLEMGCGTHRAAMMHLATAEGFQPIMPDFALITLEGKSASEQQQAIENAVKNFSQSDKIVVARAGYTDCQMCKGTGSLNGNPCEGCNGIGEVVVGKKKRMLGGPGSGNFGHSGRPGQVGGSGDGLGEWTEGPKPHPKWIAEHDREVAEAEKSKTRTPDEHYQQVQNRLKKQYGKYADISRVSTAEIKKEIDKVEPHLSDWNAHRQTVVLTLPGKKDTLDGGAFTVSVPEAKAILEHRNAKRRNAEEAPSPRIKSEGGRWTLYSSDGSRKLGEHTTREAAESQSRAILAVLGRS